jgi:hypothetical protein
MRRGKYVFGTSSVFGRSSDELIDHFDFISKFFIFDIGFQVEFGVIGCFFFFGLVVGFTPHGWFVVVSSFFGVVVCRIDRWAGGEDRGD